MGSDLESGLTGIAGDPSVGELCDYSISVSEGCSNTHLKKKTTQLVSINLKSSNINKTVSIP